MVVECPGTFHVEVFVGVTVTMMETAMFAPALEQSEVMGSLVRPLRSVEEIIVRGVIPAVTVLVVMGECGPER